MNSCPKCHKKFTRKGLAYHLKRKIPCDRKLECKKCHKIFKHAGNLKKHLARKTPCEPIAGDPTKPVPVNTCHYCFRSFSTKGNLKQHFGRCKMKSVNGMKMIYEKMVAMEKKNKEDSKERDRKYRELEREMKKDKKEMAEMRKQLEKKQLISMSNSHNNNTINYNDCYNTNINIYTFRSKEFDDHVRQVVQSEMFNKLRATSNHENITTSVLDIFKMMCRPPDEKLHNVICPDPKQDKMLVYGGLHDESLNQWIMEQCKSFMRRLYGHIRFVVTNVDEKNGNARHDELMKYIGEFTDRVADTDSWRGVEPLSKERLIEMMDGVKNMLYKMPATKF